MPFSMPILTAIEPLLTLVVGGVGARLDGDDAEAAVRGLRGLASGRGRGQDAGTIRQRTREDAVRERVRPRVMPRSEAWAHTIVLGVGFMPTLQVARGSVPDSGHTTSTTAREV